MAPWGATSGPKGLLRIHAEPRGTPCTLGPRLRFSLELSLSLSFSIRLSFFSFGTKWDSDTLSKLLLGALARLGGNLGGQRSAKP